MLNQSINLQQYIDAKTRQCFIVLPPTFMNARAIDVAIPSVRQSMCLSVSRSGTLGYNGKMAKCVKIL